MMTDISDKLKGVPESVQNCATNDHLFYTKGACSLEKEGTCPYASKKFYIQLNGKKLPACERYHPRLKH